MLKLTNIAIQEGLTSLPGEKLLKWFLDRANHTFVFFDTETTGLHRSLPDVDQITQISAIACEMNMETLRFFEVGRFDRTIKLTQGLIDYMDREPEEPNKEEDPEGHKKWEHRSRKRILKMNHYDFANSDEREDETKALSDFDNFLNQYGKLTMIAHNAPFDLKWIQFHDIFANVNHEVIDSMQFFKRFFFPILNNLSQDNIEYKKVYDKFPPSKPTEKTPNPGPSSALTSLATGFSNDAAELEKKINTAHNSLVDCEIMMDVVEKGLLKIYHYLGR